MFASQNARVDLLTHFAQVQNNQRQENDGHRAREGQHLGQTEPLLEELSQWNDWAAVFKHDCLRKGFPQ